MKLLFDLFPVLLFFIAYQWQGFYAATATAMAASAAQVLLLWIKKKKVETMYLASAGLIILLGSTTLFLKNELFFQWKPTAINWIFALVFLASHFVTKKTLIQRMMEKNISLPSVIWRRLSISWILFFFSMGAANLYVVYHFTMATWVNFKVFGVLGLTIFFIILQAIYLARHVSEDLNQPATEKNSL